jgi:3-hydroxyacyl-CoA dehydrogenase
MKIRKVGVAGAGTMGSGIAALVVSAGIPVVLLDVAATGSDRSAPARAGRDRAKKTRPAAVIDPDRAAANSVGYLEDDQRQF